MKRISVVIICVLVVLGMVGCAPKTETLDVENNLTIEASQQTEVTGDKMETVYPLTIIDGYNREVVIESELNRVVSLAPSVTETLFAIGAGDKLVGRTDYCLYPEETAEIASIGSLRDPNIEAIVELNPDMVIASTHFKDEVLKQLEDLKIPVIVLTAQESFEGVYENTQNAGLIMNRQKEANQIVESMKEKVEAVLEAVKGQTPKSVYYVVGYGERDHTATGDTFINQMLTMAGGDNIAKDGIGWSYNFEKLLDHNPEVILVSDEDDALSGFCKNIKYQDLDAVKNKNVKEINIDLVSIQGPRLATGLQMIAERLHPEQFEK